MQKKKSKQTKLETKTRKQKVSRKKKVIKEDIILEAPIEITETEPETKVKETVEEQKPEPKEKPLFGVFGFMVLIAVILIGAYYLYTMSNATTVEKNETGPDNVWSNDLQIAVDSYAGCPGDWESQVKPRPFLPAKMYCHRPPLPANFGDIARLYELHLLNNLSKVGPEYWDQPEFFPNFKVQVVPLLKQYDASRWAMTTPESFPSGKVITNVKPGYDLTGETLVRSGPLSQRYIWVDAYMIYPETFYWEQNHNNPISTQNSSYVSQFFDVKVSPDKLLLEPSFPVWPEKYTFKVQISVHVKENVPKGRYAIGLTFDGSKDAQLVEDSLFKYGLLYQDSLLVKPSTPWYTLYIQVE